MVVPPFLLISRERREELARAAEQGDPVEFSPGLAAALFAVCALFALLWLALDLLGL